MLTWPSKLLSSSFQKLQFDTKKSRYIQQTFNQLHSTISVSSQTITITVINSFTKLTEDWWKHSHICTQINMLVDVWLAVRWILLALYCNINFFHILLFSVGKKNWKTKISTRFSAAESWTKNYIFQTFFCVIYEIKKRKFFRENFSWKSAVVD